MLSMNTLRVFEVTSARLRPRTNHKVYRMLFGVNKCVLAVHFIDRVVLHCGAALSYLTTVREQDENRLIQRIKRNRYSPLY